MGHAIGAALVVVAGLLALRSAVNADRRPLKEVALPLDRKLRRISTSLDERALNVFLQAAQVLAHRRPRPLRIPGAQRANDLAVLVVVLALTMQRTITEAWDLDLREGVLDKYLYANADRLFFSRLR